MKLNKKIVRLYNKKKLIFNQIGPLSKTQPIIQLSILINFFLNILNRELFKI